MDPLDNPVWHALRGPHRALAETSSMAARYRPHVSLFGGFPEAPGRPHWDAMEALVGAGGVVIVTGPTADAPPAGWSVEYDGIGVQLTGEHLVAPLVDVAAQPGIDVLTLGATDASDMVDLVGLARPGPFSPATWELGGYVGVRRGGRLVAMAGQRFRPAGWCEISAVATHPEHRRQGLGQHLVRIVVAGIAARGEIPFLHTARDNSSALRLYESMGFVRRREVRFLSVRAPGRPPATTAE